MEYHKRVINHLVNFRKDYGHLSKSEQDALLESFSHLNYTEAEIATYVAAAHGIEDAVMLLNSSIPCTILAECAKQKILSNTHKELESFNVVEDENISYSCEIPEQYKRKFEKQLFPVPIPFSIFTYVLHVTFFKREKGWYRTDQILLKLKETIVLVSDYNLVTNDEIRNFCYEALNNGYLIKDDNYDTQTMYFVDIVLK